MLRDFFIEEPQQEVLDRLIDPHCSSDYSEAKGGKTTAHTIVMYFLSLRGYA